MIEPRLPDQDRLMTVENSALRTPEVAYALATSLISPKDQELLNRMDSSELVGKGYHGLIRVKTLYFLF